MIVVSSWIARVSTPNLSSLNAYEGGLNRRGEGETCEGIALATTRGTEAQKLPAGGLLGVAHEDAVLLENEGVPSPGEWSKSFVFVCCSFFFFLARHFVYHN